MVDGMRVNKEGVMKIDAQPRGGGHGISKVLHTRLTTSVWYLMVQVYRRMTTGRDTQGDRLVIDLRLIVQVFAQQSEHRT